MVFKYFLTVWFLIFTLLSGAAWSYAGHGDENHVNPVLDAPVDQGHPLSWQNDNCSDHCCHTTAHFVGLVGGSRPAINAGLLRVDLPLSDILPLSCSLAPPFHPPII